MENLKRGDSEKRHRNIILIKKQLEPRIFAKIQKFRLLKFKKSSASGLGGAVKTISMVVRGLPTALTT